MGSIGASSIGADLDYFVVSVRHGLLALERVVNECAVSASDTPTASGRLAREHVVNAACIAGKSLREIEGLELQVLDAEDGKTKALTNSWPLSFTARIGNLRFSSNR